ncbi:hypothetical protein ACFWPK_34325 [Nocardia sp. NPDC058519]|uniref:hypothetical protein n=1 Tax=Nocardia sp. NPDC058519 TaxID=3346535 RepID=UPI00364BA02E
MSRREYVSRFPCAEPGCPEKSYTVAGTQRERADDYKAQRLRPWRCYRHTRPDEVLAADNLERTATMTAGRSQYAPNWRRPDEMEYLSGQYWLGDSETSVGSGILHGPGFKAIAGDFPIGTKLIVTARIELPSEEGES